MKPFTKLFSSITSSSIWRAPDHVRLVWITMLAMADKDGEIWASVGGLADLARVNRDDCERALGTLASPDEDSRTKLYDGRRIEVIDGGWRLLNYKKYRDLGRNEDRREYFAEHKRKSRSKSPQCPPISTPRPQMSPIAEAEAEAEKSVRGTAHTIQPSRSGIEDLERNPPPVTVIKPVATPPAIRLVDRLNAMGVPYAFKDEPAWLALVERHTEPKVLAMVTKIRSANQAPKLWAVSKELDGLGISDSSPRKRLKTVTSEESSDGQR